MQIDTSSWPASLETEADVKDWFTKLIHVHKLNFHPDDSAEGYVDGNGDRIFTHKGATLYNKLMEDAFEVCDPYEVGSKILESAINRGVQLAGNNRTLVETVDEFKKKVGYPDLGKLVDIEAPEGWSWEHPGYWFAETTAYHFNLGDANGPLQCDILDAGTDVPNVVATLQFEDQAHAIAFMRSLPVIVKPKVDMQQRMIVLLVMAELRHMQLSVSALLRLYQDNPWLNAKQPYLFERIIPCSLDEWVGDIVECNRHWKELADTALDS